MKSASIRQFVKLRQNLEAERASIIKRLNQVESALGSFHFPVAIAVREVSEGGRPQKKRARNEISLKEAVLKVTSGKSLTKSEILAAVQKLGYKFSTGNPTNSLSVVLYGKKPKFKNQGGKFSPA